VGLCAVAAALWRGAGTVIGIDPVAARRERAARLGAVVAAPDAVGAHLGAAAEADAGASAVVEAAGTQAAQALAFSLVRPGGTLSVISVQTSDHFAFTPVQAYDANITVRFGRASVRAALDRLLPVTGDDLRALADVVITDPDVPLADGPVVYERFAQRASGIVKAVFAP
jgi:threonine dehydrogenase-like Zn-dependent dehydrogenase